MDKSCSRRYVLEFEAVPFKDPTASTPRVRHPYKRPVRFLFFTAHGTQAGIKLTEAPPRRVGSSISKLVVLCGVSDAVSGAFGKFLNMVDPSLLVRQHSPNHRRHRCSGSGEESGDPEGLGAQTRIRRSGVEARIDIFHRAYRVEFVTIPFQVPVHRVES
ncbi:hypothetical protein SNOG_13215 [Parastagonospora nodorum SN15]|uniref:Uncharacterized protein n=1 Tax=Phaeosphaeria nodorum (strain SN15 / ATCC MYA-4574 / FGSC 10173) TaxID=321614 RepID=Q0U4U9_PHANO|nr:hypothetical protein SNOG_13215 [Parastagonospora nodorum SN15]EAT79542.1 hypothetical protein SNOG_13215 [Parastagonospora nodorum SN15]